MSDKNITKRIITEDSADEFDNASSFGSASTTLTNGQTSRSNTPTMFGTTGNTRAGAGGQGSKKTKKKKRLSKMKSTSGKYTMTCMAREDHGQPIFGCQFNNRLKPGEPKILATVGSNRVTIYECSSDGKLKVLQVFADPDTEETFYCCTWTEDGKGKSLLAAAGARGIIRIFSPAEAACVKHFLGHGNAVNDLIIHPSDHNLLLSASKDHSLRLWNILTEYCVAIFGGVEGHRDEVLAADIKITGSHIVSCGMDHSLKVWKLNKPELQKTINLSYTYNQRATRPFPTVKENFPEFSTRDIHRNYVDCTKWHGDFVFSKSCEHNIVCWKAGKTFQTWDEVNFSTTETTIILRLDITDCDIWFMRFSMDIKQNVLALGNVKGKCFVYDLSSTDPNQISHNVLTNQKCNAAIRQTAFSRDGNTLVFVCDDATIWRWDVTNNDTLPEDTS